MRTAQAQLTKRGAHWIRGRRLDLALCGVLAAGTVFYLYLWPRDLYHFDEGLYLYESKRLLDGDVMYRDFFEIITPGSFYFMAMLFHLFGVSMITARMGMAVVHALIVVIIYQTCRELGIRRSIAAGTAAAHIAICYPALTIASPHWVGTCLTLMLLFTSLRIRWTESAVLAAIPGIVVGALILVQQQKGLLLAVAGATILVGEHPLGGRGGRALKSSIARLAFYGAGIVLTAVPAAVAIVVAAGAGPVIRALVLHPLVNYRGHLQTSWGAYASFLPELYVLPRLIKYLPVIVPVTAVRAFVAGYERGDTERERQLLTLSAVGVFAILSILYYPDYTHLAMIAPVCFILVADAAESALRWGEAVGAPRAVGGLAAAVLIGWLGWLSFAHIPWRQGLYPVEHETAFGSVAFRNPDEVILIDRIRELTRRGLRDIFCYPYCAGLYLTTGTVNPTRYEVVIPGYTDEDQVQEVIDAVESKKVPYVVVLTFWVKWATDPVVRYLDQRYERVDFGLHGQPPEYTVFRRRD